MHLRETAAERLTCVVERVRDEPSVFSPRWGTRISTFRSALIESASANSAGSADHATAGSPRHGLVVVELRDERLQHLPRLYAAVGAREEGAIAPVLPAADEEHLDAGLPAILMSGEDIGVLRLPD